MPTGYTADVANGEVSDFRTFALRCARAFGATILQRDDPANDPPKHKAVGEYYLTAVEAARAEVAGFDAMTVERADRQMRAERTRAVRAHAERAAERTAKRNRYNAMLADVVGWSPPTAEHQGLKDFMVQQLTESRAFDCSGEYDTPPAPLGTASDWLETQRADARRRLARAEESLREEQERCAGANAWIDALYASLPVAADRPAGAV